MKRSLYNEIFAKGKKDEWRYPSLRSGMGNLNSSAEAIVFSCIYLR